MLKHVSWDRFIWLKRIFFCVRIIDKHLEVVCPDFLWVRIGTELNQENISQRLVRLPGVHPNTLITDGFPLRLVMQVDDGVVYVKKLRTILCEKRVGE